MAAVRRILQRLAVLYWSARTVPWLRAWRLRDDSATVAFWMHGRRPDSWLRYLAHEDTVILDAARLRALVDQRVPFRFVFGDRIREVSGSTVVYSIHPYNPSGDPIRSDGLRTALTAVQARHNRLVPPLEEVRFWEDKVFMHGRFDELGVRTPSTRIVDDRASLEDLDLPLPLIVKDPWSYGSLGVERVDDPVELDRAVGARLGGGCRSVILQQLLDIRADVRVTTAGGRVVHGYVRQNPLDRWSLTLARFGSTYRFESLPERWERHFAQLTDDLGLSTAAFDVCWMGEDRTEEPYVLEVSPAYQLHPEPPEPFLNRPYREYMVTWMGRDSHAARRVALFSEVQGTVMAAEDLT